MSSTVSRRACLTALAAAPLLAGAAAPETKPAARPNILWLIAEDFGPALGCYGQTEVATPNLDQLAREGVRYDRMYTTAPVCSPSRSAFMTGMYATTIDAHQHRSHRNDGYALPDGVRVISEWMRDAGYYTANVVQLPPACGFKGTVKTDWNFTPPAKAFDTNRWVDVVAAARSGRPFFAQVNFDETHRTFHGPAHADRAKVVLPPYYPDHPVAREDYARYLDSATDLDRKVGKVLEQLRADGLAESTVVVFFGDNGEAHVRGKQFCYEEGLHVPMIVRWPAGFAAPRQMTAGGRDDRLLMAIDLAPTMLAIAGAAIPPRMQGRAFLGDPARGPAREYVFGGRDRCDETAMRIRTVRDARWRYIRNYTPGRPLLAPNNYKAKQYPVFTLLPRLLAEGKLTPAQAALCAPRMAEEELYDMEKDPHEVTNLAGAAEHAQTLKRLRGALEAWVVESDDQGRHPEPAGAYEASTRPARRP